MKRKIFNVLFLCVACTLLLTALAGCSESDDTGGNDDTKKESIKLQKLDLSGAKYLTLFDKTRAGNEDEVGLFKIDENGNMSTVVLSCTEEEDGAIIRTRTDIKVIPREVQSLSGVYTYMPDCEFTDEKGNNVWIKQYYEPDAGQFDILVRNADGAIFYIPKSLQEDYFSYNGNLSGTTTDGKGNLYLFGREKLGQLTTRNGELVIKQINPNNVGFYPDEIIPFDNGTVMVHRTDDTFLSCTIFYPNGGFEEYVGYRLIEEFEDGGYSDEAILPVSKVKSGIKAIKVLRERRKYTVSLHDFRVGTSYGEHTLSDPLASLSSGTDYSTNPNDPDYLKWVDDYWTNNGHNLNGIYETENKYFIGKSLIVDKRTMEMRPLEGDEANIIFPSEYNTYKGRAWNIVDWGAEWYDIETLQFGKVNFNLPQNFKLNNTVNDIPSGKVIYNGIRYSDGMSVSYFVDIETGNYTCTESHSERPVTALIPLN